MRTCLLLLITTTSLLCVSATPAQEFLPGPPRLDRANTWELGLGPRWLQSQTFDFRGGSSIELDKDTGFGFDFAYNFTSNLSLGVSFDGFEPDYHASIASADPSQGPDRFRGTVRLTSAMVDGTYNILRRSFTPFVTAGVGFMHVDTDVPQGPPLLGCWWDPWFGYVCNYFVPTQQEDEFAYRAELGLRWDITPNFFVRGSYGRTWLDVAHGASDTNLGVWKIDLGFRP